MSLNKINKSADGGSLAKTITGTVSVINGSLNVPFKAVIDKSGYCTITIQEPLSVTITAPTLVVQLGWHTTNESDIENLRCDYNLTQQFSTPIWLINFVDPSTNGVFDLSSSGLPAYLRRGDGSIFNNGAGPFTTICSFSYQTRVY